MNSTIFSHFTLTAFLDIGVLRYLVFLFLLLLYVLTVSANLLLILVVSLNRTLAEPMYVFLCSLCLCEVYGSTMLFPMLLHHILHRLRSISASFCFLQIYMVHSYSTIEYLNLAIMSYDRYLAICHPLHYHSLMSRGRIGKLITLTWLYGLLIVMVTLCITTSLKLCGNTIPKVYCDNYSVVRQACSDISVINIYGLIISFTTLVLPFVFMIFTYVCILRVCFLGSKQTRQKAVSTCTPHLVSIVNFTIGGSFELVQSRFDMSWLPIALRVFLSLYCISSQPLLNPLMYGLNISRIRQLCKSMLLRKLRYPKT